MHSVSDVHTFSYIWCSPASSLPSKSHQMLIVQILYSKWMICISWISPFINTGWKVLKIFLGFLEITAFFALITARPLPPLVTEMWMMNHGSHSPEGIICHLWQLQAVEVGMNAGLVLSIILLPLKHLRWSAAETACYRIGIKEKKMELVNAKNLHIHFLRMANAIFCRTECCPRKKGFAIPEKNQPPDVADWPQENLHSLMPADNCLEFRSKTYQVSLQAGAEFPPELPFKALSSSWKGKAFFFLVFSMLPFLPPRAAIGVEYMKSLVGETYCILPGCLIIEHT